MTHRGQLLTTMGLGSCVEKRFSLRCLHGAHYWPALHCFLP